MKYVATVIVVTIAFFSYGCKKEAPKDASMPASSRYYGTTSVEKSKAVTSDVKERSISRQGTQAADESKVEEEAPANIMADGRPADPGIAGHFYAAMDLSKDRLLEYRVNLDYRCTDLQQARLLLLAITSKYGFVRSESTSISTTRQNMNTVIAIKADRLYDALLECDRLGRLENESIIVTDHTGNMVLSDRKAKREQVRSLRRARALDQGATKERTWREVEDSLSASEDAMDGAEHAKWGIRDTVTWATLTVTLRGPESARQIEVPRYVNVLVWLANFFLNLLYVLLGASPFIALIAVVIWKRKAIIGLFRRRAPGQGD